MILYYALTTIYVLICFMLLLVILLQQGKGGDMASAFGGGSSQTAFGARGGATLMTKLTTIFAVLFMLGALTLAIMGQRAWVTHGRHGRAATGGDQASRSSAWDNTNRINRTDTCASGNDRARSAGDTQNTVVRYIDTDRRDTFAWEVKRKSAASGFSRTSRPDDLFLQQIDFCLTGG